MEQRSIKAIDKVSVARICSGQVITDLATAVKELVENSLDAGAKHVEVKLKEFGLDLIEVSDNGSGVSPSNYEGLALKYHTSKLSTFSDLSGVKSFGFRGEALSSLCELAGSFSVTTRATGESVGVKLTYGRDGKLLGKVTAPRQVGTTVSISNMFEPLPVRRGEFRRNVKKQYNRLLRGMQAYALISLGVRITVTNTKAKGGKQTLIGTQYNNRLDDNVTNVFGAKFLSTLSRLDVSLEDEGAETASSGGQEKSAPDKDGRLNAKKAESSERKIWGMVSKAGEGVGRADNDRQFIYLNGRPVDLPKFTRAVSEVWRTYEMKQKPAFILDLRLPPGSFDVNVTPDKREIFMTGETEAVDHLKQALHELWAPSRYTIPVNQGQLVQARLTGGAFTVRELPEKSPPPPNLGSAPRIGIVSPGPLQDLATTTEIPPADKREIVTVSGGGNKSRASKDAGGSVVEEFSEDCAGAGEAGSDEEIRGLRNRNKTRSDVYGLARAISPKRSLQNGRGVLPLAVAGDSAAASDGDEDGDVKSPTPLSALKHRLEDECGETARQSTAAEIEADTAGDADADTGAEEKGTRVRPESLGIQGSGASRSRGSKDQGGSATEVGVSQCDVASKAGAGTNASPIEVADVSAARTGAGGASAAPLAFTIQGILSGCRKASRLKRKRDSRNASASSFSGKLSGRASADDQDSNAAARAFSRVLNKEHFTQMRVVGQFNLGFMICLLGSDLFILDQHACDEKYNFEVLQKTTIIHQQPLVRPLPLETSASEEMTIIDNITVFEKNGFRFTVDDDQPTTKKLKITAVPFSKGTQFGVNDVHELASIVADNNSGEMVRLPKARAMFASRACRSSIMIGKALDRGQMARVVAKMATIEQPWNCPHGRPTMRHLADVSKSLRAAAGLDALLQE